MLHAGPVGRRENEFAVQQRVKKSEDDCSNELTKVSKAARSILNRLVPSNFAKLSGELAALEVSSKAMMEQVCCCGCREVWIRARGPGTDVGRCSGLR